MHHDDYFVPFFFLLLVVIWKNKHSIIIIIIPGDLPGDECLAPPGTLVVEEDAVAGVHIVGLAVVYHRPTEANCLIKENTTTIL